jgi:hypothetical protein
LLVGFLVHQVTEGVGEGRHVLDVGLEVEVEAIKADIAERTKSLRTILLRTKGFPDESGSIFSIGI